MCDYDYYRNLYKAEVLLYTQEYVKEMQQQILPYIKAPICRIIASTGKEVCGQCSKRASFYNVNDHTLLCWKHGNELSKS
jgi:hypothetical protein